METFLGKAICTNRSGLPGSPCQVWTCARPQSLDRTASSLCCSSAPSPPTPPPTSPSTLKDGCWRPAPPPTRRFPLDRRGAAIRPVLGLRYGTLTCFDGFFFPLRFICRGRSLARRGQSDPNSPEGEVGELYSDCALVLCRDPIGYDPRSSRLHVGEAEEGGCRRSAGSWFSSSCSSSMRRNSKRPFTSE